MNLDDDFGKEIKNTLQKPTEDIKPSKSFKKIFENDFHMDIPYPPTFYCYSSRYGKSYSSHKCICRQQPDSLPLLLVLFLVVLL